MGQFPELVPFQIASYIAVPVGRLAGWMPVLVPFDMLLNGFPKLPPRA